MPRIRTIKPDFFRHERLHDAEKETGLPLRLAFIALWTVADREGRFKWRPRSLKADCMPMDEGLDFAVVLNALAEWAFIARYEVNGETYGLIPSFGRHQIINNREAASVIPAPSNQDFPNGETRTDRAACAANSDLRAPDYSEDFLKFWHRYPTDPSMSKQETFRIWKKLTQEDRDCASKSLASFKEYCGKHPEHRVLHAWRYLAERRFEGTSADSEKSENSAKIFISKDTPQWRAWEVHYRRTKANTPPSTDDGGWWFPSEYPPAEEAA